MKPKSFIIKLTPYPFDILVSIGQKERALKKVLNEYGIEYSDPDFYTSCCRARTQNIETGQTIMRFKEIDFESDGHGLIAHEVFHAVEFLFLKIKMPHSVKYTSEAYAYLIGHVTEHIYKNLE